MFAHPGHLHITQGSLQIPGKDNPSPKGLLNL